MATSLYGRGYHFPRQKSEYIVDKNEDVSDIHEVSVWKEDTQLKMLKLSFYKKSHIIWL